MPIIKKIIPTLLIIFITWCSHLSAEEIKKIGKYKDWQAMVVTSDSGKMCFAQSLPVLQGPKSNNKRDAKFCIMAFKNNQYLGLLIFLGIYGEYIA